MFLLTSEREKTDITSRMVKGKLRSSICVLYGDKSFEQAVEAYNEGQPSPKTVVFEHTFDECAGSSKQTKNEGFLQDGTPICTRGWHPQLNILPLIVRVYVLRCDKSFIPKWDDFMQSSAIHFDQSAGWYGPTGWPSNPSRKVSSC